MNKVCDRRAFLNNVGFLRFPPLHFTGNYVTMYHMPEVTFGVSPK